MTNSASTGLFWAPRILTILFALFLSVFALDVFSEKKALLETLAELLLHLIPTFFIIGILAAAWRRESIGAYAFAALAIGYVVGTGGRLHWTAYATISGPMLLISVLFLLSWRQRLRARAAHHP